MTTPVSIPDKEPFDAPRGTIRGSVKRLPGDTPRSRATVKMTAQELAGRTAALQDRVDQFKAYLTSVAAGIESQRGAVEAAYDDLPDSQRSIRVGERMKAAYKRGVAQTEDQRRTHLNGIHTLAAEIALQAPFWVSEKRALASYAWSVAAAPYVAIFASAGPVQCLSGFEDSYASRNPALGGVVLAAFENLDDKGQRFAEAHGFDKEALARQLIGADFDQATAALHQGRIARMEAEAADKGFREGNPLGDAYDNLTIGRLQAGYDS